MHSDEGARREALGLLAVFQKYILPGALRRMRNWRGLAHATMADVRLDAEQELALDCVANTAEVLSLPDVERHRRWLRLAERTIRQILNTGSRYRAVAKRPPEPAAERCEPDLVPPMLVQFRNGRPNLLRSAARLGSSPANLRRELTILQSRLGRDDAWQRFWQARLAEALVGLAADVLRWRRAVHLLGVSPDPDPERRVLRVRRLLQHVLAGPITSPQRRRLRSLQDLDWRTTSPRAWIDAALELRSDSPAAWSWLGEACCAAGDHVGAARAIRRWRRLPGGDRGAAALLRARLLARRQRPRAATCLLRRAASRWRDARLGVVVRSLPAPSTAPD